MRGIKKRNNKKILDSKILMFVLIVLVLLLINSSYKMYKRSENTKLYLSSMTQKYEQLQNRYNKTKEDLKFIESATGQEKEIREKFDLAKEGEKAIVIIDEEINEIEIIKNESIWQKFVNWVSF